MPWRKRQIAPPPQPSADPAARPREHSHPPANAPEGPHAHPREHHDHPHPHYISVKLRDVSQLFNSMDPSPFIEKDLDDDAEEFIVSWAQEYPADAPLRLRIYVDQWPAPERDETGREEDSREMLRAAVHNHFAHRAELTRHELTRLLKQGRTSLVIGVVFLSACLGSIHFFLAHDVGTWAAIARESLTIAGWVAMWRPMQIYLYDWWPVRRRERVFHKLSHVPVELLLRSHESRSTPHEPAARETAVHHDGASHESASHGSAIHESASHPAAAARALAVHELAAHDGAPRESAHPSAKLAP